MAKKSKKSVQKSTKKVQKGTKKVQKSTKRASGVTQLSRISKTRSKLWKLYGAEFGDYKNTAKIASLIVSDNADKTPSKAWITKRWKRKYLKKLIEFQQIKQRELEKIEEANRRLEEEITPPQLPANLLGEYSYFDIESIILDIPNEFSDYKIYSSLSSKSPFRVSDFDYENTFKAYYDHRNSIKDSEKYDDYPVELKIVRFRNEWVFSIEEVNSTGFSMGESVSEMKQEGISKSMKLAQEFEPQKKSKPNIDLQQKVKKQTQERNERKAQEKEKKLIRQSKFREREYNRLEKLMREMERQEQSLKDDLKLMKQEKKKKLYKNIFNQLAEVLETKNDIRKQMLSLAKKIK